VRDAENIKLILLFERNVFLNNFPCYLLFFPGNIFHSLELISKLDAKLCRLEEMLNVDLKLQTRDFLA
jgi:hypothetical protein